MTTLLRWLFGALLLASLIGSKVARAQQPPAATDSAPAHLVGAHVVRYRPLPGSVEHVRFLLRGTRTNGGCSFHSRSRPGGNSEWVVEYDVDSCTQIRARGYLPPPVMPPGMQHRQSSFSLTIPLPSRDSVWNQRAESTFARLSPRERALIAAVRYVRGSASEELRSIGSDSINVDASSLLDDKGNEPSSAITRALAETLHAAISWTSSYACGRGLSPKGALLARGQCAVKRTEFYIEASEVSISTDEATVMVHVFRRPGAIHRPDYIGYTIALRRTSGGWAAPRLVGIAET
jgi:hypothetical protein